MRGADSEGSDTVQTAAPLASETLAMGQPREVVSAPQAREHPATRVAVRVQAVVGRPPPG